ncbi:N-acetylmuramoyl-L-alanine amidase [Bartonella sp. CB189]|uniref:N-acetylmuramoyl-L-alanine amidase n=1 Tax=Bartonella sp. CB189 TaxID=3112254 RepID=UPI002F96DB52
MIKKNIQRSKAVYRNIILRFICGLLFFLIFQSYSQAADTLKLISFRTIGDNAYTRIIAVFNVKPNVRLQVFDHPARLIINLPTVDFSSQSTSLNKKSTLSGMISNVRYGFSDIKTSRIILTSKIAFSVEKSTIQKIDNDLWQLLIDIKQTTQKKFDNILKDQQKYNINTTIPLISPLHFCVVIDPGHGGMDGGAQGVTGVLEKNITLAFARALQNELKRDSHINVILTRDSNTFLRLSERVKKAQQFNADLFISIHADSIGLRYLRGATVYTISDKASDEIAKSLAESENKVDLLDGLPEEESIEITDILTDLIRRETHTFSVNFANSVISNLSKSHIKLINNPHRYAGFQVLKAPDIPSVLIEIGYLSNKEDEQLLNNPNWRKQVAVAIANSIRQFAAYKQKIMQTL